ncbi:hypothetical protein ETB97_007139 [Aspergillus alliaceus]|uniref:YCII-related domain-containing protein n=1 Tax=Petromyces alliaceus TaxID=209559 RepID=A0A8H6A9T9_PETAA|nr:hypothetical protein ETB97_007139 [Aspergillus burnettii]
MFSSTLAIKRCPLYPLRRYALFPFRLLSTQKLPSSSKRCKPKEFLCILPDKTNALENRKNVRQTHYEGIKPLVASGRLVAGGAMLQSHPGDGEDTSFKGSMIIYTGESVEDVRSVIMKDIYAKAGVWDLEKVQIIPYVSAIREPMS